MEQTLRIRSASEQVAAYLREEIERGTWTGTMPEEAPYLFAAIQFCGDRKLLVPKDISLVCSEHVSNFEFANPPIAHTAWDYRKMIPRIVRWADNVARGKKDDKRQTCIEAKFVEGGTIGPAPDQS